MTRLLCAVQLLCGWRPSPLRKQLLAAAIIRFCWGTDSLREHDASVLRRGGTSFTLPEHATVGSDGESASVCRNAELIVMKRDAALKRNTPVNLPQLTFPISRHPPETGDELVKVSARARHRRRVQ